MLNLIRFSMKIDKHFIINECMFTDKPTTRIMDLPVNVKRMGGSFLQVTVRRSYSLMLKELR
ncbi:hypothetical protein KTT_20310 [Tengunoibacter tsumagoiensis]|uniref:Uncharacterized protein n=1 Tax=Tengunoibacter tsumagoiensis TaxID=2014871 RepID=A0A401ZZD7_9CHLR|nr:hypothetical protein KTT_20310 [Tengunoibacter tsumagoiensis]